MDRRTTPAYEEHAGAKAHFDWSTVRRADRLTTLKTHRRGRTLPAGAPFRAARGVETELQRLNPEDAVKRLRWRLTENKMK